MGTVQVKANLQEQLRVITIYNLDIENVGQGHEYNFRNDAISTIFDGIFYLALIVSEILAFDIFGLEKVGQGHRVQISQWRRFMVNMKIYKSHNTHFCVSSHRLREINI